MCHTRILDHAPLLSQRITNLPKTKRSLHLLAVCYTQKLLAAPPLPETDPEPQRLLRGLVSSHNCFWLKFTPIWDYQSGEGCTWGQVDDKPVAQRLLWKPFPPLTQFQCWAWTNAPQTAATWTLGCGEIGVDVVPLGQGCCQPVCVCVRSTLSPTSGFHFYRRGMLATCAVGIQRRRRTCPVISRLITSTYLCISCDAKSFWPPWLRRCLCFLFFRVTCSLLEGSRVHREQNPHPLETHQLYSRLISCTRKISTLWSLSVFSGLFLGLARAQL